MGEEEKTKKTTSNAVAKVGPRTVMKKPKKKPSLKVAIQDAEVVKENPKTPDKPDKSDKSDTKISSDKSTSKSAKTPEKPASKPDKTSTATTKTTKTNNKSEEQDMKLPKVRRLHFKIRYVIATIVVLILAGFFGRVAIWEHDYLAAKEGSERDVTVSEVYDGGEEVDEEEPTEQEIIEYHVAANRPRYISIPSLGIYNSRVVEIGLRDNGEIGTPYNIYDTGWYVGSVLPGQEGVSLMDAHGGDLGYGIFRNLPKIALGADIIIEMGDETTKYTYKVTDIAAKALGDEANSYMTTTAMRTPVGVTSSLTLITCTGDWLLTSQTYSKRLFVRAALQ